MRQGLHKQDYGGRGGVLAGGLPSPPATVAAKGGKGTSDARKEELGEMSVAKIIEEKPGGKEVCSYFQKVCDELTKKKMAE